MADLPPPTTPRTASPLETARRAYRRGGIRNCIRRRGISAWRRTIGRWRAILIWQGVAGPRAVRARWRTVARWRAILVWRRITWRRTITRWWRGYISSSRAIKKSSCGEQHCRRGSRNGEVTHDGPPSLSLYRPQVGRRAVQRLFVVGRRRILTAMNDIPEHPFWEPLPERVSGAEVVRKGLTAQVVACPVG